MTWRESACDACGAPVWQQPSSLVDTEIASIARSGSKDGAVITRAVEDGKSASFGVLQRFFDKVPKPIDLGAVPSVDRHILGRIQNSDFGHLNEETQVALRRMHREKSLDPLVDLQPLNLTAYETEVIRAEVALLLIDEVTETTIQQPRSDLRGSRFAVVASKSPMVGKSSLSAALLIDVLATHFGSVARAAAWNLALLLEVHGLDQLALDYYNLAMDLGSGHAAYRVIERALEAGDEQERIASAFINVVSHSEHANRVLDRVVMPKLANYPQEVRDWFRNGITDPGRNQIWDRIGWYQNSGLVHNVEAHRSSIATKYFGECEESCFFHDENHDCAVCGRSTVSTLGAMSGNGDGYYFVFDIHQHLNEQELAAGAFTLFDPAASSLWRGGVNGEPSSRFREGEVEELMTLFAFAVPLYLGTLDETDKLIIADSSMQMNGRDFSVIRRVHPSSYAVFAWLGINDLYGEIRPTALMALPESVTSGLSEGPLFVDERSRKTIIGYTYGQGNLTVSAHVSQGAYAPNLFQNYRNADTDVDISYLLQGAEFVDEGLWDACREVCDFPEKELRNQLRLRGIENPQFPWREERDLGRSRTANPGGYL